MSSKGYRFYSSFHSTIVEETRHAKFFENLYFNGSVFLKMIKFKENKIQLS